MGTSTSECSRWSLCSITRSCVLLGLTQKVGPSPCMIPNDESYELRSPCFQFLTGRCDHVYCTTDDHGQTAPDDYCESFISHKLDQNYCSSMMAICPVASTCYGENVEVVENECSNGYVLCTDVDNEDNRYMYNKKDLDFIENQNDVVYDEESGQYTDYASDEIPF